MRFGQHIKLRWWQRGGREKPTVEEAWEEGIDVAIPGRTNSDVRYHSDTNTAIVVNGTHSGTVLKTGNMVLIRRGEHICGNCATTLQSDHRCPNDECPN